MAHAAKETGLYLVGLLVQPRQHAGRVGAHGRLLIAQALQHGGLEGLQEVLRSTTHHELHMPWV